METAVANALLSGPHTRMIRFRKRHAAQGRVFCTEWKSPGQKHQLSAPSFLHPRSWARPLPGRKTHFTLLRLKCLRLTWELGNLLQALLLEGSLPLCVAQKGRACVCSVWDFLFRHIYHWADSASQVFAITWGLQLGPFWLCFIDLPFWMLCLDNMKKPHKDFWHVGGLSASNFQQWMFLFPPA